MWKLFQSSVVEKALTILQSNNMAFSATVLLVQEMVEICLL
jgi:hypothetical protein